MSIHDTNDDGDEAAVQETVSDNSKKETNEEAAAKFPLFWSGNRRNILIVFTFCYKNLVF